MYQESILEIQQEKSRMISEVCVFSVLHQGSVKFYNDFLQSLDCQTHSNFDLFLVVDSVRPEIIEDIENKMSHKFKIIHYKYSGGILENRVKGLEHLVKTKNNYQTVAFVDSDDVLAENYIEEVSRNNRDFEVVVSDLVPFSKDYKADSTTAIWNERFKNKEVFDVKFLKDKNMLGFGNTSINFKLIERLKSNYPEPLAPDWYFFKDLLALSDRIKFNKESFIFYRQHSSNIAGYQTLTHEKLRRIFQVKCDHYKLMYYNDADSVEEINAITKILNNEKDITQSISYLNQKSINFFWWEETTYLKKDYNE